MHGKLIITVSWIHSHSHFQGFVLNCQHVLFISPHQCFVSRHLKVFCPLYTICYVSRIGIALLRCQVPSPHFKDCWSGSLYDPILKRTPISCSMLFPLFRHCTQCCFRKKSLQGASQIFEYIKKKWKEANNWCILKKSTSSQWVTSLLVL